MSKFVRSEAGSVYTPYWHLQNPRTGRSVHLIGMMHVGDEKYYRKISSLVELLACSSNVHYELIRKAPEDGASSAEELQKLRDARATLQRSAAGALAEVLGLNLQKSELSLPKDALNHDFDDLTLFRKIGWGKIEKVFDTGNLAEADPEILRKAMRFVFKHYMLLSKIMLLKPSNRQARRVILDERNKYAFTKAKNTLEAADLTLIWGAAHLPGLRKLFEAEGFTLISETWFKACEL